MSRSSAASASQPSTAVTRPGSGRTKRTAAPRAGRLGSATGSPSRSSWRQPRSSSPGWDHSTIACSQSPPGRTCTSPRTGPSAVSQHSTWKIPYRSPSASSARTASRAMSRWRPSGSSTGVTCPASTKVPGARILRVTASAWGMPSVKRPSTLYSGPVTNSSTRTGPGPAPARARAKARAAPSAPSRAFTRTTPSLPAASRGLTTTGPPWRARKSTTSCGVEHRAVAGWRKPRSASARRHRSLVRTVRTSSGRLPGRWSAAATSATATTEYSRKPVTTSTGWCACRASAHRTQAAGSV